MKLILKRIEFTDAATHGELYIGDDPEPAVVTLELPDSDGKPGSCIPQGTYPVICAPSPKFELSAGNDPWVRRYASQIPHIIRIPDRTNILLHWGNTPHDTNGCILVGKERLLDSITDSRKAFEELWNRVFAFSQANITLEVQGGYRLPTINHAPGLETDITA